MCSLAPIFYVQCRKCAGEGQVWKCRWDGDWYSPPEDIYDTCPNCLGIGSILSDEPENITLQELQWLDEEISETELSQEAANA